MKNETILKKYSHDIAKIDFTAEEKSSNTGVVNSRFRHRRCSSVDATRVLRSSPSAELRKRKYNRSITVAEITTSTDECENSGLNVGKTEDSSPEGHARTCTASIRFGSMRRHRSLENALSKAQNVREANKTQSCTQKSDGVISIIEMKKEISSVEAKYKEKLEQLSSALAKKEEEVSRSKVELEEIIKQKENKYKTEKSEITEKLIKDKELTERNLRNELELKEKQFEDELNRRLEEELSKSGRRRNESSSSNSSSSSSDSSTSSDEENGSESNKRKRAALEMELLLLKQQGDEFEELVRDKHRRQMELEAAVAECQQEVDRRGQETERVRVELSYARAEVEQSRAKLSKLQAELDASSERVTELEGEVDRSGRELQRIELLQEKLCRTEKEKSELQTQLSAIEEERDEEIKIIQDALDEAALEREELLAAFDKELVEVAARAERAETKARAEARERAELTDREHRRKLEELERKHELAYRNVKRGDEEESSRRIQKARSEVNSEWEDKLRREVSRLKTELEALHAEEKHLAVESVRVTSQQELTVLRSTCESRVEEAKREAAELKRSLADKDAQHHTEMVEARGRADRDIWELRRKLQKLDESAYDKQQATEEKHREEMERLREEYVDRVAALERQVRSGDAAGAAEVRAKLTAEHRTALEDLQSQHSSSMERLRDEMYAERFQAVEEARVMVTQHHETLQAALQDRLSQQAARVEQCREEVEATRREVAQRDETIKGLETELALLRGSSSPHEAPHVARVAPAGRTASPEAPQQVARVPPQGRSTVSPDVFHDPAPVPPQTPPLASPQAPASAEGADDDQPKTPGLLGKVFGGAWFSGPKNKEAQNCPNSAAGKKRKPST